jgi:hypothetical protein
MFSTMKYLCSFILMFIIMIIIIITITCNEIIVITVFRRDKLFNLALFTIIVILLFIFVFFISISAIFYERNYNSTYLSFLRCTIFYLPVLQSVIYAMLIKAPSKSWWLCKCSLNCFYLSP